jgi:hypothetical protein
MKRVFIVHHVRDIDGIHENVKTIGVFSSQKLAEAAVIEVKDKPGFRDSPEGFSIDEYEIDRTSWTDGYGVE